jgi:hypothetical protein
VTVVAALVSRFQDDLVGVTHMWSRTDESAIEFPDCSIYKTIFQSEHLFIIVQLTDQL